jgi:hypothetical protein
VKGLRPTSLEGHPCRVAFIDNSFTAPGAVAGAILDSEYSNGNPHNRVDVTALGCSYPNDFGSDPARPIAKVNERRQCERPGHMWAKRATDGRF